MNLTQVVRKYAILTFIALAPIAYWVNADARVFQENFFELGAICLVALFIGDMWIGSFIILNVALFVYNGASVGFAQVLNVTIGSLLFMLSRGWFKTHKFNVIYKPLLITFTLSLIFIGLQFLSLDPLSIGVDGKGMPLGTPNHDYSGLLMFKASSGIFSVICYPILASISLYLAPIALIPIFLSSSTSVMMALVVVTLFYTLFLHRRLFLYALIASVLAIIFFMAVYAPRHDEKKFVSRLPLWHYTLKKSFQNPIGYGPDSFRNFNKHKNFKCYGDYDFNLIEGIKVGNEIQLSYYSPTQSKAQIDTLTDALIKDGLKGGVFSFWDNPHNEYLNLLFCYGFFGVFLFCGFFRSLWMRFKLAKKDKELIVIVSCLLVYFVTGLTHFPLLLARTAFLFPILLGAFFSKTDEYVQP